MHVIFKYMSREQTEKHHTDTEQKVHAFEVKILGIIFSFWSVSLYIPPSINLCSSHEQSSFMVLIETQHSTFVRVVTEKVIVQK